jgi:hypothetical protein
MIAAPSKNSMNYKVFSLQNQITLSLSQKIDGGLSPFLRKDYSMSPLSTGHRVLEDGLKVLDFSTSVKGGQRLQNRH